MIEATDLGLVGYNDAWGIQQASHAKVLAGAAPRILLVEHPPVITYGRRPGQEVHLLASQQALADMGVELVQTDRGGDVTFHGPGQLVVYPILRLTDFRLTVSGYVRLLEASVMDALVGVGIASQRVAGMAGVWTPLTDGSLAKICAVGVRISRGVTLHGVALNVTTDLRYFNLIVPCGLAGRPVTRIASILGAAAPPMEEMKQRMLDSLQRRLEESRSHERSAQPASVASAEPAAAVPDIAGPAEAVNGIDGG